MNFERQNNVIVKNESVTALYVKPRTIVLYDNDLFIGSYKFKDDITLLYNYEKVQELKFEKANEMIATYKN
jgi:hypothetical protein